MTTRTLKFTVDALLLGEIGERLVTRNYIALAELVKNAYDADSNNISIEFIKSKNKASNVESKIIVTDDGHGMTIDQIQNFWMRIATPNKISDNITPYYGRIKTGSKGVGRFACARLGSKLILETVARNNETGKFERVRVVFSWDDYVPGKTLTEVPNKYTVEICEIQKSYTKLELVFLREPWSNTEFNVLRRQILGLAMVSPIKRKGYHEDPGFNIEIIAPEFEMKTQLLSEQVMDAGWGRLKGSVAEDGTTTLTLQAMKIGEPTYVFSERFSEIPFVNFDIAIIQRRKEYCRDESTLAMYSIDKIFENWSGIKVFLDGFRVYPYGDPKNDWLDIDEQQARRIGKINPIFKRLCKSLGVDESRALLNQPRNQNLVGRVFLTNQTNRIFNIPITREGFIENKASKRLRELLIKAVIWVTVYYNRFLYINTVEDTQRVAEEFVKESSDSKEIPEVLDSAINVLNDAFKDYKKKVPSKNRTVTGKYFEKALDVVKQSTINTARQTATLRTVASTGAVMHIFSHEIHDLLSRLSTIANKIDIFSFDADDSQKSELINLSILIKNARKRLSDQIKLFSGISTNLANMKKHRVKLSSLVQEVIDCYDSLITRFSLDVKNQIPKNVRTGSMLEAEVYSISLNLISNAIKAAIAGHGKSVKIEVLQKSDALLFRVYDDGIGLSDSAKNIVFSPLVADPENKLYNELSKRLGEEELLSVGQGSGLGLSIVSDILQSYGKKVRFLKDEEIQKPWKTCVEAAFPI